MDFKFGHSYIKPIRLNFDWGRMQDNQRMVFTIPVNDIPQEDNDAYVRRIALLNVNNRDYFIPTRRNPDIPDIVIIDHLSLLTP